MAENQSSKSPVKRGFTRRADESELNQIKTITEGFARPAVIVGGAEVAAASMASDVAARPSNVASFDPAAVSSVLGNSRAVSTRFVMGTICEVPLSEIVENRYNARRTVAVSKIDELGISMQTEGQQVAATGYVGENGKVHLIDGGRRLLAARSVGLPTLRIDIREMPETSRQLYLSSRRANGHRVDQNPLDDAIAWFMLLEEGVYKDQQEIAEDTGLDEATVSKILTLRFLPRQLIARMSELPDLLTLRMLTAIRRYHAECSQDQDAADSLTDVLVYEICSKKLSARDVEAKIANLKVEKSTRKRAQDSWKETYGNASVHIKRFADKNSLTLELQTPEDPQALLKFEALLKQLLEQEFRQ